ncbi:MAG: response regulator [Planctomycetes bacterium]|nr:response regulator [Planctomycetota bacterium]
MKRAVGAFLEVAWGELSAAHWPKSIDFDHNDRDGVLKGFVDEKQRGCMRKFSLRLGNRRYPFMKMVFQELLFRDCFFFSVDTHDELDIKETTPDYQEWLAIRDYNAQVKSRVEELWRSNEIPTLADVLERVDQDQVPPEQVCRQDTPPRVWVVDDEPSIAEGVRRTLEKRRYEVRVFPSAEEALAAIRQATPDLIISDLEMGNGLTGLQFCEQLRTRRDQPHVPFILATAAGIDLTRFNLIDGFIVKPYEVEVLCAFVAKHLRPART